MIQPYLTRRFGKSFDWLQVEVTSWCNAQCAYCPRTAYRHQWMSRHLSLETFHRLLPDLRRANLVYLQGWGEPFLHPDFFTFVSLAKQKGCRVGTTTNGMLLTEALIAQLVESKLDVIAFSLAGIGDTHNDWRRGTRFRQVLEAIGALQEYKSRLGENTPEVNIAYMLLRSGLKDLERLPETLQGLGISQVVISTLDLVVAPELEAESLSSASPGDYAAVTAQLEELATTGARQGLAIHYPRRPLDRRGLLCPENVQRALVVSAAGDVSPCVYTNLPGAGVSHFCRGRPHPVRSLFWGNLRDSSLQEIWQQPAAVRFRHSFQRGAPALPCQHCLKLQGGRR